MSATQLFDWLGKHRRSTRLFMFPLVATLVAAVYVLVYRTGGIKLVFSHSMYVPIVLSGFVFGIRGGILIGLIAGLTLGPFMPIDVATGELQSTTNWLYRTGFFTLIGFLSGSASDSATFYLRHLKWLSQHDTSTQLPNRVALIERLAKIAGGDQTTGPYGLAILSFNNAMELKSAFGFSVIEEAIRQLADRFGLVLQHKAPVYRTDTEQVGILLDHQSPKPISDLTGKLLEVSRHPLMFDGIPIHVDARIGFVEFSEVSEPAKCYIQKAETALVEAHERSLDSIAFSPAIIASTRENIRILGELKDAMKNGQLSLHYQPKIVAASGEIHSVEALMRWNHPGLGNIPPGRFIPRAEQSTLINAITEFALDQAMAQMARWQQCGIHISTAVNISTRNLLQPGFTSQVLRTLDRYGLDGERLELEVTEGSLMLDMAKTIDELTRLSGANIIISVDDFGTGYSSLQYLHRLPISLVKIDQSFVRRLPHDKGGRHIVETAVDLTHRLGIQALAEGVETKEAFDYLNDVGCDLAQGFHISRPLTAEDFSAWHKRSNGFFHPETH